MAKKDRRTYRYMNKPLLIITVVLFLFGLIMVFSASNVTAYMSYKASPYNYFIKQGVFLLGSFIFSMWMVRRKVSFYGGMSWFILIVLIASLAILLVYGKATNNAVSWYDLGLFKFQPSEFIKVVYIVWFASYYERIDKKEKSYFKTLFPIGVAGIIAVLIMLQPDLGTAIIFMFIVGVMFLSTPISKVIKYKTVVGVVGAVLCGGLVLLSTGKSLMRSEQTSRFDFRNPCDKLLTTGSQVCNGYIAINNGGLTGLGLGNSTQKYLYLPEPYTDFIYAIIVEELGAITGIVLILAYVLVLYLILLIGRQSITNKGCLMCYGVAVYIFAHIAINLLGLFGLMPLTGVPLPFMSYGGSFTFCLIAALTVVQRVNVETRKNELKTN